MSTESPTLSLDEFCMAYSIPQADQERLRLLGFFPGDPHAECVPRSRWADELGFSQVGWTRVILAGRMMREMQGLE